MTRKPYTTVYNVARVLCKSPQYVLGLIKSGRLSAERASAKSSSAWLIAKAELDSYLASLISK